MITFFLYTAKENGVQELNSVICRIDTNNWKIVGNDAAMLADQAIDLEDGQKNGQHDQENNECHDDHEKRLHDTQ